MRSRGFLHFCNSSCGILSPENERSDMKAYRREFAPYRGSPGRKKEAERKVEWLRGQIKRKYHALIPAVEYLEPKAVEEKVTGFATDGEHLFYHPDGILRIPEQERMVRFLHIILHGLLGHFNSVDHEKRRRLYWAVMDLSVMSLLQEMSYEDPDIIVGHIELTELTSGEIGNSLYYKALKDRLLYRNIVDLSRCLVTPYQGDDHSAWALPRRRVPDQKEEGIQKNSRDQKDGGKNKGQITSWKEIRELMMNRIGISQNTRNVNAQLLLSAIIGDRGNGIGSGKGYGEQEVQTRGKALRSYQDLIHELSSFREVESEESFPDPILYTYGLDLYEDVPLIEPLEQKEQRCLNSVVIAVDTSGSCEGSLERFWEETRGFYRDLAQEGGIKKLHYLECDDGIGFEECYEGISELPAGAEIHRFYGLGGTSFVPVFEKTSEYQKNGEEIDCLIYFSDGYGEFPSEKPDYPVYYVLPEEDGPDFGFFGTGHLPDWINAVVLKEKEEMKHGY